MKKTIQEYSKITWQKKWTFIGASILILIANTTEIIAPFFYKEITNQIAQGNQNAEISIIYNSLLIIFFIYSISWVSWRFFEFALLRLEVGGMAIMQKKCFQIIQSQKYQFFQNEFIGSVVKKGGRFIYAYEPFLDWIFFNLIGNLVFITAATILFYFHHPLFCLYFIMMMVVFISFAIGWSFLQYRFFKKSAELDSSIGGFYSDSLSNIFTVKTKAAEKKELKKQSVLAKRWEKSTRKSWIITFVGFGIQAFLWIFFEIFLTFQMIEEWRNGNFSVGEFVMFQADLFFVMSKIWDFGRSLRNIFGALAESEEFSEILQNSNKEKDFPMAEDITIQKGSVSFQNITFSYDEQKKLFKNFSLSIRPGEKIALVGHSGSGKTSLTNLLFRFFHPQKGRILFDDIENTKFTLNSLRRQISLIPQHPEIFHRTIKENLVLGDDFSDKEICTALTKARCMDFIEKMPDNINTLVGERGVKLSGGEKQRIAIARAFLDNAPIIVLDEATSALDSLTEKKIQESVFELIENKTAIVVAHRLSTILKMDRIIVLENGEIIEEGTHHQLIEKKGKYAQMWSHQTGDILAD